ncbi:TPA: hypothetical protein ACWXDG_003850, partial [Klebsiella pneumoniae]
QNGRASLLDGQLQAGVKLKVGTKDIFAGFIQHNLLYHRLKQNWFSTFFPGFSLLYQLVQFMADI